MSRRKLVSLSPITMVTPCILSNIEAQTKRCHKMAIEASAKNLSTFHNGQWIWYSSGTTEFPYSRLTHSYTATEDFAGTLPISKAQKTGLCVSLALTALVNFGLLCHNVTKARKIGKGNTKVVRKWLRISSSLGKMNMGLNVRKLSILVGSGTMVQN